MKILSLVLIFSGYLFAIVFETNMDKKVYYDANRDNQDKLEQMSKKLKLFITDKASKKLILEYKTAKVKATKEELALQKEASKEKQQKNTTKVDTKQPVKAGFMAKLLEKLGIGSTNKIIEINTTPVDDNKTVKAPLETIDTNTTQNSVDTNTTIVTSSVEDTNVEDTNTTTQSTEKTLEDLSSEDKQKQEEVVEDVQ